jgi:long-chain fatty acid transport protein
MKIRIIAGAAAVLAAVSHGMSPSLASEGYFSHGYGAINKSMAGAGVALGFDAMSQAINPAATALVDTQFTIDFSVSGADRSYTATGAPTPPYGLAEGNFGSESDLSYLPSMANVWEIDGSSSWGWALYGNSGTKTTWNEPAAAAFGSGPTGADLGQAFLQFTYAQEISPEVYIGIGPVLAFQRFEATGLANLAGISADPGRLTDKGYDWSWGYGGKVGIQAEIGRGFSFGAAYQTEMFMTDLDKYSGLLAGGGEFNIPATLQAGFAWRSEGGFIAELDYKRIFYSDIDALSNGIGRYTDGGALLGSAGGPGFGWDNVDIVKLGIEVPLGSAVKLRAGAAMNTNPVPESEVFLNVLTPDVLEQHYTAGLTWQIGDTHAVTIAGMYAPPSSVEGVNALDTGQTIKLESSQWEATVGWSWTF